MVTVSEITAIEGSVTPSGISVETNIVNITDINVFFIEGYLSLRNMVSGDTVTITEYVIIDNGGTLRIINQPSAYSGVQSQPELRFPMKVGKYGYKVTVTQTGGTLRAFPYAFQKFVLM